MMNSEDQTIDESNNEIRMDSNVNDGDTYPISDNDSASLPEENLIEDELNESMSNDSLMNDDENKIKVNQEQEQQQSSRPTNHDEHIKSVIRKKEEVENLRLQRFQEQLRKKEQKSQEQQIEKVKKWLQLRNRDSDHRIQVEERRRKLEEEARAKFDEILRREKEREQRTVHVRGNLSHKPECLMSVSTDIISSRRAISAPHIRTNSNMNNRRTSTDSPSTSLSQDNADHSASPVNSHQVNRTDEHRHRSRHSQNTRITPEENSLSGREHTSAQTRIRQMPTSYSYWINTGDNQNTIHANFMRPTYAASCRARLSRSVERCPRACRGHDETSLNTTTTTNSVTTTNADSSHRRVQSVNRQQLYETICRLSKPKVHPATASSSSSSSPTHGISSSQSSHQIRASTPNQHINSTITRRKTPSRPVTAPTNHVSVNNNSRASQTNELSSSTARPSSHRTPTRSKPSVQSASKPPISSAFTRSKPAVQRSLMTTSFSSLTLSSSPNKQNSPRITVTLSSQPKSPIETQTDTDKLSSKSNDEQTQSTIENTIEQEIILESNSSIEVNPNDANNENMTSSMIVSKREQQIDEQEYQRKLNQNIREAQQRLELERQREEERQRQLQHEEYEREQEQIRLAEEQRQAEQERLQRAIDECQRENELKRQEEQRLQQQREENERKQAEEIERVHRERQERMKKEEEERNERKRRLDLIMRRTRQVSPNPKQENTTDTTQINGHEQQIISSITHSNSDSRFPTSLSNDNINSNDSTVNPETSNNNNQRFRSPLIQSLLDRARNSRSTDNLSQSNMTTSQIQNEIETIQTNSVDFSDDDDDDNEQHDSGINNTTNGHSESPLSSSTYLEHPIETPANITTAFQ